MSNWNKSNRYRYRLLTYFMAFGTVFITISMVKYPKEAFDSAIAGVTLWWNVVFPSLLPFFILSEILMGLGVVHFIGVLLEPLMRPVFNVPGIGAFALSMGLASGYPMDAVITGKFRQNKLCSAVEAERLLSFTNTADPLFMFGAVAVGMFGQPELGATIALAHYLASFLVGVIYRFHGRNREPITQESSRPAGNILLRAFHELYKARQQDNRSFGQLLGDAVKSSMNTILLVGGFIILFSVLLRIIAIIGITDILSHMFSALLSLLGFSTTLAPALVSGLFELDLGALAASQANAPLIEKIAITSAIVAWSGLSVHAQVASIVIESGIRMAPYMLSRLLHAIFALLLTLLFMKPAHAVVQTISMPMITIPGSSSPLTFWLLHLEQISYIFLLFSLLLIGLSMVFHIAPKVRYFMRKYN
ncbi:MAG: ylbJ [Firmicutes bacterium]|nr:ylbJ [Bacillota bacterium]